MVATPEEAPRQISAPAVKPRNWIPRLSSTFAETPASEQRDNSASLPRRPE